MQGDDNIYANTTKGGFVVWEVETPQINPLETVLFFTSTLTKLFSWRSLDNLLAFVKTVLRIVSIHRAKYKWTAV